MWNGQLEGRSESGMKDQNKERRTTHHPGGGAHPERQVQKQLFREPLEVKGQRVRYRARPRSRVSVFRHLAARLVADQALVRASISSPKALVQFREDHGMWHVNQPHDKYAGLLPSLKRDLNPYSQSKKVKMHCGEPGRGGDSRSAERRRHQQSPTSTTIRYHAPRPPRPRSPPTP